MNWWSFKSYSLTTNTAVTRPSAALSINFGSTLFTKAAHKDSDLLNRIKMFAGLPIGVPLQVSFTVRSHAARCGSIVNSCYFATHSGMRGIGNICEVLAIPSARFIKQGEEDGGIPWLFASASKSKKWTLC